MPSRYLITKYYVNNTNKSVKLEGSSVKVAPWSTIIKIILLDVGYCYIECRNSTLKSCDLRDYKPPLLGLTKDIGRQLYNSTEALSIWFNLQYSIVKDKLKNNFGELDKDRLKSWLKDWEILIPQSVENSGDFGLRDWLIKEFDIASLTNDEQGKYRTAINFALVSLMFCFGVRIDYLTKKRCDSKKAISVLKLNRYNPVMEKDLLTILSVQLCEVSDLPPNSLKRKFNIDHLCFEDELTLKGEL